MLVSAAKHVDVIDYHFYQTEPPVDILTQVPGPSTRSLSPQKHGYIRDMSANLVWSG